MTNNLLAIDQFLESWKNEALYHYTNLKQELYDRKHQTYEPTAERIANIRNAYTLERVYSIDKAHELSDNFNTLSSNEQTKINKAIRKMEYEKFISDYTKKEISIASESIERIKELLEKEVVNKKKQFINKIEKKAGAIIDTSYLKIGHDGSLNGIVQGSLKTVEVETVFAGGYNIQCLHYRVLVK